MVEVETPVGAALGLELGHFRAGDLVQHLARKMIVQVAHAHRVYTSVHQA